jgi:hypothetical protein
MLLETLENLDGLANLVRGLSVRTT